MTTKENKGIILPPDANALNKEDRLAIIASLLVKAGYTVRIRKEKTGNTTRTVVEYWEDD